MKFCLLAVAFFQVSIWAAKIPITILHTNDVHGRAWAKKGRDGIVRGGYAAQATLVAKIRKELHEKKGILLVLSAGDVNTGVPESDLLDGEPDIHAMNHIRYDAMVLGNHEFDRGIDKIKKQMGWAKFPFLSANVRYKSTQQFIDKPYIMVYRNEVNIAVIGLTTWDLGRLVLPAHVAPFTVEDPRTVAKKYIPKFKSMGADIVIGLTHLGIVDERSIWTDADTVDDKQLARDVEGLDIIVGGHTDTFIDDDLVVNKSIIVQAGNHGKYLGRLDLIWDQKKKKIVSAKNRPIPILPMDGEDAQLKKQLVAYKKKAGDFLSEKIGTALTHFDGKRENVRTGETNLGNLICDVLRMSTKSDIALFNSGGIRASIEKGPITLRDIYKVLPFGNTAVTATITGKQLREALQTGLKHRKITGSFLQTSGLKFTAFDDVVTEISVGNKPISPSKLYKLVTNNFILSGGDHFTVLTKSSQKKDTGIPVEKFLIDYIRKTGKVTAKVEGRTVLRTSKPTS